MSVRTGRRALWRHERRGGVCSGPGCCVPLLLLCGAYVLRCVCEGLLFDRAASLQALHPNCNGVRGGSRDGHARRIPHTTTRPFEAHHTSSACLCVVAVTRTTRWPSASGCSRHTLWINSGGTAALHRRACGSPAVTAGRLKPATDARITLVTTLCLCGTCLDPASNSKCCLPYSVLLPQMPRRCADNRHSAQRARELLVPQWLPRIKRTNRLT